MQIVEGCRSQGADCARVLRYQYVVSRRPIEVPGLEAQAFGGLHVLSGSGLPVTRLRDAQDRTFGLLLGIAVAPGGVLSGTARIDDLDAADPGFWDKAERWLDDLAGRYTLIMVRGTERRLYSDPVGMNGVVYNPRLRRVASSLLLCLDDPVRDRPDYDHALNETAGAKYVLFDTRDKRVRRMNPSCRLDLTDFAETRFWPREAGLGPVPSTLSQTYDEIIATASHATRGLIGAFPCALPLTGGRDSRLIAGFAGPDLHKAQVYTHVTNYSSRQDAALAAVLADRLGVPHLVHDYRKTRLPPEDLARMATDFRLGLGHDATLPGEVRTGVNTHLPDAAVVLRGHQTDILRAVFTNRPGAEGRDSHFWQIKRLMPVPYDRFTRRHARQFGRRYASWAAGLSPSVQANQIDLMFVELYYASSVGATFPALNRNFYLSPFNSRRLIALSMSIDEGYRRASLAVDDLLYRMSPALHDVPLDYETGASLDDLADPAYLAAASAARSAATAARSTEMVRQAHRARKVGRTA